MESFFKTLVLLAGITLTACSAQRVINSYEGIIVYSIQDNVEYPLSGENISKTELTYENAKTKQYCHADESQLETINCDFKDFNRIQKNAYGNYLKKSFDKILLHADQAPKYDGNQYNGEISFCVDKSGQIDEIVLARPSGHKGLDNAFIKALVRTNNISLPSDPALVNFQYYCKLNLYYDDRDMAVVD